MSTGYDDSKAGVKSVVCAAPPNWGDDFIPNIFCGLDPFDTPFVSNPGVQLALASLDCSFETWIKQRKWPEFADTDNIGFMGFELTLGGVDGKLWLEIQEAGNGVHAFFDDGVRNATESAAVSWLVPWMHVVVNVKQSNPGSLQVIYNGIDSGTDPFAPVGAGVLGTGIWTPLTSYEGGGTSNTVITAVQGPFAFHIGRLVTVNEAVDAYYGRYVNHFPETVVLWDQRTFEGVTEWEMDVTKLRYPFRGDSPGFGPSGAGAYYAGRFGSPKGVDGTVRLIDLSGNGNHWVVPTRPEYGDSGVERAYAHWGMDPFWR